jgi:hypothetical protein
MPLWGKFELAYIWDPDPKSMPRGFWGVWGPGGPKVAVATLPALRGSEDAKEACPKELVSMADPRRLGFPKGMPWLAMIVVVGAAGAAAG